MINKIRWRFVAVTMISLLIVLVIIIGGINAFNYKTVREYSDTLLQSLAANGGHFVAFAGENSNKPPRSDQLTAETQFETRYFTVTFNTDSKTAVVDTMNIASVDTQEAYQYAVSVINDGKNKGYDGYFRYLVYKVDDASTMVLFVDSCRQLAIANEFMEKSVWIAVSVLIGVFILVVLLSKKAVQPIAESYEKQKRFITDASHELKTPLTIISANNEIMEMDYGENESTKSISKQVARMADMTKNLTMLAKIDESDVLKEKGIFNLSETVCDVAEPYIKTAESVGKKLNEDGVEDNVEITGDERLIRQMLSLLLYNSMKYGKNEINVSLKTVKKNVELIIENDTNGITQGNLDRYFERFYRSDESRASGVEGSGIGLSIVKEIVTLHKGKITATGAGDMFTIKIVFEK